MMINLSSQPRLAEVNEEGIGKVTLSDDREDLSIDLTEMERR